MQLPSKIEAVLAELARYARARFGPRLHKLVLYGSYARGEADPFQSDLDVLVVVDDLTWAEHRELVHKAAAISCEHNLYLSPLALTTARYHELRADDRLLYREVERDGVPL